MIKKITGLAAISAILVSSCNNNPIVEETPKYTEDVHSYAKPNEAVVMHLDWNAQVDFETKKIEAIATWDIDPSSGAEKIIFDTYGLDIKSVTVDGNATDFTLGSFDEHLGTALQIPVTEETRQVAINYQTTDSARALQWLDPEQTAGKSMPFLFTQSQAILARSWVPTQDGPGIRFTYNATVQVPDSMLALMSAENPKAKNAEGIYHFKMPQPIPSYLLALAVGDVEFEEISNRTGVYAEPSMLEESVYEFADLEKMVQEAEKLYGPYAWGQYDLIVLPPSFPFGGMENPRLTFATPTILAGDRSLVSLVAHELAHSWSGNLVTNATWDDFWLNEGFTVYFEHRIMEAVYGKEYAEMLASLTRDGLKEAAADMLKSMPNDTKLKLDLKGRNPDDGVTSIPYDKGYFFLRLIEETVGREKWDAFLNQYFSENKFKVMTTEGFIEYLKAHLLTEEQYKEIKADEWIYQTGIPDNLPQVNSNRFAKVDSTLEDYLTNGNFPKKEATAKWTTHEWLHFINGIPDSGATAQLTELDEAYALSASKNSEIAAAWFQPAIRNQYEAVYPHVDTFLVHVGRRKFLTPTYKALKESGKEDLAKDIYSRARPNYHAVSRETMDDLLGHSAE